MIFSNNNNNNNNNNNIIDDILKYDLLFDHKIRIDMKGFSAFY